MASASIVRNIGEEHTVQLLVTKDGLGITGLLPKIEIRRLIDGKYLNHAATSSPYWITTGGSKQASMTEVSWTAGLYKYKFQPGLLEETTPNSYDCIVTVDDVEYPIYMIEHLIYVMNASSNVLFDNLVN